MDGQIRKFYISRAKYLYGSKTNNKFLTAFIYKFIYINAVRNLLILNRYICVHIYINVNICNVKCNVLILDLNIFFEMS